MPQVKQSLCGVGEAGGAPERVHWSWPRVVSVLGWLVLGRGG